MPFWKETTDGIEVNIRLTPKSRRPGIHGVRNGYLLVAVNAPAIDGAANKALVALLAKTLRVPKSALKIIRGTTSRQKTVSIALVDNATKATLESMLYAG